MVFTSATDAIRPGLPAFYLFIHTYSSYLFIGLLEMYYITAQKGWTKVQSEDILI